MRFSAFPRMALVGVCLIWDGSEAASQDVREVTAISGQPSCPGCTISVTRELTLGTATDSILPSTESAPARDSQGRYFVPSLDGYRVIVYDGRGRVTGTFGRRGEGPGEFLRISQVTVSQGDTLFVKQGSRLSVFSPSLQYVRTLQLPVGAYFGMLRLASGRFVYSAALDGAKSWGHLFNVLGASGERIGAIGRLASSDSGCLPCIARSPIAAGPDRVWAVRPFDYLIEGFTESGVRFAAIEVMQSAWFDPRDAGVRTGPNARPKSALFGVDIIEQGLMATYGRRAAENWQPRNVAVQSAMIGGRRVVVVPSEDRAQDSAVDQEYDTFIDVIDLERRVILNTGGVRSSLLIPIGGGLAYSRRVNGDGFAFLDIYRVRLQR